MNILQAALYYVERGHAVIPLWRDARKNPHLNSYEEYYQRPPSAWDWRRWSAAWQDCNLGLLTGYHRRWVALDFDDLDSYDAWQQGPAGWLAGKTWTVATRRGVHVWFEIFGEDPGPSQNYTLKHDGNTFHVLLRGKGGYCIVPPSIHHTGATYHTICFQPPILLKTAERAIEGWEAEVKRTQTAMAAAPATKAFSFRIEDLIPIPEGARANGRGVYSVTCPFHDDRNASAWLNPEQGRFGCHVCCEGQYWDVVNVYARLKGITNKEAFKAFNLCG